MKKTTMLASIFFVLMGVAQASDKIVVPIGVERGLASAYQQQMDSSQRNNMINLNRKAYIEMMDYVRASNISYEEKEGILRNVESMYPNNYIMQKNEAINRVNHIEDLMKSLNIY